MRFAAHDSAHRTGESDGDSTNFRAESIARRWPGTTSSRRDLTGGDAFERDWRRSTVPPNGSRVSLFDQGEAARAARVACYHRSIGWRITTTVAIARNIRDPTTRRSCCRNSSRSSIRRQFA